MKLNIGCGNDILKGYVNVDRLKMNGVNIVHDLDTFPYPFKDESIEEIRCISILEHVKDISRVMEEFYRILKKGGRIIINVPHFTSTNTYSDPTHLRGFSFSTFDFYCGKGFYYEFKFKKTYQRLNFGKLNPINWFIEPLANRFPSIYEDTPLRIFPALNIDIILEKEALTK